MADTVSIYIHIPFCVRKCNYCDFLSFPASGLENGVRERYVEALLREIEGAAGRSLVDIMPNAEETKIKELPAISTIYIGGGTPNLLSAGQISEILCKLNECFAVKSTAEISMEMNPGIYDKDSADKELELLRKAGINRISIGLQSADDRELKRLGRIHDFSDFEFLYAAAGQAGFENINVDLISSIPLQTAASFTATLEAVTNLKPQHISVYSLIIEDGTPFAKAGREELDLPEEDEDYEIYLMTREFLRDRGYKRYEISNYALPGYECAHNLVYWNRGPYLGLGPGAASFINGKRFSNTRDLNVYLEAPDDSREDMHELTQKEAMEEFFFLGLRKTEGVSLTEFKRTFGCGAREVYKDVIEKYSSLGLLAYGNDRLSLTGRGMDLANEVMAGFIG